MNAKQCFKCGEVKDLSCFYRHPGMKDGRVNKCKECNKRDVRQNRKHKVDYYREYDRERGSRQPAHKIKAYNAKYPKKYIAKNAVNNAIRDGRLLKPNACEVCGAEHNSIHGHHDDYSFPLQVRWLCPPCHFAWHLENGEGKNGI